VFRECPASPGSCCVGQNSTEASGFYQWACGSGTNSFNNTVLISPNEVTSLITVGPVGGPFTTYALSYFFSGSPMTLSQIVVSPQSCYGKPMPTLCTECLDPAVYQIVKLQNAALACDTSILNQGIGTRRCAICDFPAETPCRLTEHSITYFYDLVCNNAQTASFDNLQKVEEGPDNVTYAVTLTIDSVPMQLYYFLILNVDTGVYFILLIYIVDGCDLFNIIDCGKCVLGPP
jgi:hypothetical protein